VLSAFVKLPASNLQPLGLADGTPKYEVAFADDFYEDIVIGVQKMMSVGGDPVIARGGRRCGVFREHRRKSLLDPLA
jgi:hypothetical protein